DLTPGATPSHFIHIAADSAAALEMKPADQRDFTRLVAETGALFGARHYRSYHFLLTLSDHVAHFGLEHHESSDDRQPERYLIDDDPLKLMALLLPHEMTHSWNGKYRRPAGLATVNFDQPMQGELLWVYEGLTDYLGVVLATRCGLWTNENFREDLALNAAKLDREPGRTWRPLADTAVAAQLLYLARPEGVSWRRSVDYYPEGDLIWLDVDTLIRQRSDGRRSLDDFCKAFCGGTSGPPRVVPYTLDDVVAALNQILPSDWHRFFQERVYTLEPRAPLAGIERGGWRLTYTNAVPDLLKTREGQDKITDLSFSLGFIVKEDGYITDVRPGSPADRAGVGASMKLLGVNSRRWTPEILRAAVRAATTNTAPIALLVENEDYFKTCEVDYHDGEKYPQLERDASRPDLLSAILAPRTP
ncbi:MAG: M61 family peptidase, partial [Verrucomicrobia bacterium]|nr:M61 family peptidase [Verrucomicrobiota bacterium]